MNRQEDYPIVTMQNGNEFHVCCAGIIDWRETDYPPPPEEQISAAIGWLRERNREIQTPSVFSYRAKHAAERFWKAYMSNGAIIVAADRLRIPQRQVRRGSLNTYIAISNRVYRKLWEANL